MFISSMSEAEMPLLLFLASETERAAVTNRYRFLFAPAKNVSIAGHSSVIPLTVTPKSISQITFHEEKKRKR